MQSLIPPWGWSLALAAAAYAVGQIHCLLIVRKSRSSYCARCSYYLGWRETLAQEIKRKSPRGKLQDLWERENPR